MKFKSMVLALSLLSISTQAAETYEQALTKLQLRFQKKAERDALSERQKAERESLKNKQKAEREAFKGAR